MKKNINTLLDRWRSESPLILKRITNFCFAISGMAIAIHVAVSASGATEPEWWNTIYPYLVGIPAGMAFVSKLTKENKGGNNESK